MYIPNYPLLPFATRYLISSSYHSLVNCLPRTVSSEEITAVVGQDEARVAKPRREMER